LPGGILRFGRNSRLNASCWSSSLGHTCVQIPSSHPNFLVPRPHAILLDSCAPP
jgi:hypothetical protein